ncbi:MAG: CAP domain-containing protein [Fluviicola sp.]
MKVNHFIIFLSFTLFVFKGNCQLTSEIEKQFRSELLKQTNELRIEKGLPILTLNDTLNKAAKFHSDYMAKNKILDPYEKSGKDKTPEDRVHAFKGKIFTSIGENIIESTRLEGDPLNKKAAEKLAKEMMQTWKDSPGHYANLTQIEFNLCGFGISYNSSTKTYYACQVFAKRGKKISGQLSKNAFNLTQGSDDCDKEYDFYMNLVINIGNSTALKEDGIYIFVSNIEKFKMIFKDKNDGIAIDILRNDQFECGKPNEEDISPIYDGVLLKPMYRDEILKANVAQNPIHLIAKVADLPAGLGSEITYSTIIINNGQSCKYLTPIQIESDNFQLLPYTPQLEVNSETLKNKGIIESKEIRISFKTGDVKPIELNALLNNNTLNKGKIQQIDIETYSSIDGKSSDNQKLADDRVKFLENLIKKKLPNATIKYNVIANENWEMMNYQLNYFNRLDLLSLSPDSLKYYSISDKSLNWDSLLFAQRISRIIFHYEVDENSKDFIRLEDINLRQAVLDNNVELVNKALSGIFNNRIDLEILFEPRVLSFCKSNPKVYANYLACLSLNFKKHLSETIQILFSMMQKKNEFTEITKQNFCNIYTKISYDFLQDWDVDKERMSNIIHPIKIRTIQAENPTAELKLNLELTYISYFGQINDQENTQKCYDYIISYFSKHNETEQSAKKLALFCNKWSMYSDAVDFLKPWYKKKTISALSMLILVSNSTILDADESELLEMHEYYKKSYPKEWYDFMENNIQLNRNYKIKSIYCE